MVRETALEALEDGLPVRGAALAYYVLLSLGPLLVIMIGSLEFFLSEVQARARVVEALRARIGPRAAETVSTVLQAVQVPDLLAPEAILTILLLLFGATAVFVNVRESLNTIWGVVPREQSTKAMVLDFLMGRLRGFVMIAVTGLVLALSVLITSGASVLASDFEQYIPFGGGLLVRATDFLASLLVIGLAFGAIYRTLPAVRIRWATVWVGAFATAVIFALGKSLVAWLIASASWTSYYGPGASVVAFLAWIYFSAQLFFIGAEFTQVWSRRRGGVMSEAPARTGVGDPAGDRSPETPRADSRAARHRRPLS